MTALTVADTASYGVVRILADDPEKSVEALVEAGYRAKLVEVFAVEVPNVPGSLATLLEALEESGTNIEYAYCFASDKDSVVVILRVENDEKITETANKLGFRHLQAGQLQS